MQSANGNLVSNNLIGLDGSGTALLGSTAVGILVTGVGAEVSNDNLIDFNVIGGCGNGIYINSNASNNQVSDNFIGTNSPGTNLGNLGSGVVIQGDASGPCTGNIVRTNTIRFNGYVTAGDSFGVYIVGVAGNPDILNAILGNNLYDNDLNGIELQNNSNNNQIPPIISMATLNSSNILEIDVTAPAVPAASSFRLDFFINTVDRNPITEGARYIGSITSVPSGQSVTQTFNVVSPAVALGNFVSATATNLNNVGQPGDTSEYSLNTQVTPWLSLCGKCSMLAYASLSLMNPFAIPFGLSVPPSLPIGVPVLAADM